MGDTLRLLRVLWSAGRGIAVVIAAIRLAERLIPAATAMVLALLVSRVTALGGTGEMGAALLPLTGFGVVLLVGHAAEAVTEPLAYLVQQRIDGAHRAAVTRLAASSPTIDLLEQPEAQRLIRQAKADPDEFSQRTPGQAALAQLDQLADAVGVAAACVVIAQFAWWLVPLLLIPALLNARLRYRGRMEFIRLWRSQLDVMVRVERWEETLASPGVGKDLRVFGLADWAVRRLDGQHVARTAPQFAVWKRNLRGQSRSLLLVVPPLLIAFTAVAALTVHGHGSVATATAALTAGASLFMMIDLGYTGLSRLAGLESLKAYDELAELLTKDTRRPLPGAALDRTDAGSSSLVRFEDVGFTYPGTTRAVLDGLNLEIRPGELLAIVGLNGAGKSTLIKLLAGLYEPTSGRILVRGNQEMGNQEMSELGVQAWRERISVVFQDFVKYELSAADNVTLGRPGVAPDKAVLEAAARDAGLGPVLDRLPDGWDTPLARSRTGGVDLSGGQWQQVVLTRALYALRTGAELLVLDEPTAHLDVRTEFEVFQRLAEQRAEAGVVLISHRLSTVRQADRIVLLDGGRITESGTHEELIAQGGGYAKLFAIQAERFQQGYQDAIEEGELL
ncbi:ABC transporter ATP-binding protein [Streptomyces jeddahensis]|uniref:Putative multidrug export ATP-binding/permease protein n=1 Tax=Streptomyces jeddahensis TaxID=1716141 RepID=A0A177HS80_9ACTN|nr:ABC transporter ATP-binding protein [Streptomyces jeddahensis]OAH13872.1 putative multidrug export ATP-binding/permease protein [Streptomyces jeddahensis]